jgi:hypothetical protein
MQQGSKVCHCMLRMYSALAAHFKAKNISHKMMGFSLNQQPTDLKSLEEELISAVAMVIILSEHSLKLPAFVFSMEVCSLYSVRPILVHGNPFLVAFNNIS